MTSGSRRSGARRVRRAVALGALALSLIATACIPQDHGKIGEVDDGTDSAKVSTGPPEFPVTGEISPELLVEGLVYDFTTRPRDQDYWSPPTAEATCAATGIVDAIGAPRLSSLGYRVATPGASLNDIGLTDAERNTVVDEFSGCVDMVEGVASLLFGDGRIPTEAAMCVAKGLGDLQMLRPFVEAWAFGRAVDPFASDSAFATALIAESQVCIANDAFTWPKLRFPDEEPLIDSDAPGGSASSNHPDDRRETGNTTTTTSTVAPG